MSVITPLSPAPSRNQTQDAFVATGNTFFAQLPILATEINNFAATINAMSVGGAVAMAYTFSSTTTDSDPNPGFLRFNQSNLSTATVLRIELVGLNNINYTKTIDAWDDSTSAVKGWVRIAKADDPTKFVLFKSSTVATVSGYRNVTITAIDYSSTAPFANNDNVTVSFTPIGDTATNTLVLITTQTASNSPTIDLVATGTYKSYIATMTNVIPVTNTATLQLRTMLAGTPDLGSTYYGHLSAPTSGSTSYVGVLTAASSSLLISPGLSTAANASFNMNLIWSTPIANTTLSKTFHGTGVAVTGATTVAMCTISGMNSNTIGVDTLRFFMSLGNISSGTFSLYGLN